MTLKSLTRRRLVFGTAGGSALAAIGFRPSDESGPTNPYFDTIRSALLKAQIATPVLIIDKERLEKNIDILMSHLPADMKYRVVSKSLPSMQLIDFISNRTNTDRLMTFNLEMLQEFTNSRYKQLLGKPLPVGAASQYYKSLLDMRGVDHIQWLVDSEKRLREYASLASQLNHVFQVNLELDIGLHRGGFNLDELEAALSFIRGHKYLRLSGFMGYEPHIAALPKIFGWQRRGIEEAWSIYDSAIKLTTKRLGSIETKNLTFNAAGSKTYRFYKDTRIANELSIGSALVKPSGFDAPMLRDYQPASFIAAPVLKNVNAMRLPSGLGSISDIHGFWNPNYRRALFIYGGNWMADPVDPPGLKVNPIFGVSSNQQMMNGGDQLDLQVDDFIFFRPRQSEAVFMRFGDIAVFHQGEIVKRWPVFTASA